MSASSGRPSGCGRTPSNGHRACRASQRRGLVTSPSERIEWQESRVPFGRRGDSQGGSAAAKTSPTTISGRFPCLRLPRPTSAPRASRGDGQERFHVRSVGERVRAGAQARLRSSRLRDGDFDLPRWAAIRELAPVDGTRGPDGGHVQRPGVGHRSDAHRGPHAEGGRDCGRSLGHPATHVGGRASSSSWPRGTRSRPRTRTPHSSWPMGGRSPPTFRARISSRW